jgi:RND family efflux transporter MFP subunit
MAGTLREELASLKIERRDLDRGTRGRGGGRGDGGIGLLALLIWLIPLALFGSAGVYAYRQYDAIRTKAEVTVGVVQAMTTGEAEKLLSAKGYLKSRYQAMIGTRIAGRVEKMFVEEGTKVKKGQILAVMEHNEMKALLASREAQVKRTQAQLEEARVDLVEKKWEADRAERLFGKQMIAVEEVQKAITARGMGEARVAALQAAIALEKANVEETKASIQYMSLFAPFDGTVVDKQGEVGEIINPMTMSTSSGRAAVVTLANLEAMDVETDVAENLLSRIAIGQPAEVSVSAVPSKHYRGRLRQVIPMGDRTRGTVKVKVEILDPDERLFPELVATVHFLPDKALNNPDASRPFLFVPKAAVFDENGHSYAWVLDDKSRVAKRQVEVAVTNDELARVESGLRAGETVVINPPKTLREREAVTTAE